MGRLTDFSDYIDDRILVLRKAEADLGTLQAKYETYYQEVTRVRERELGQIAALVGGDGARVPEPLKAALDEARKGVEREFLARLERLAAEHTKHVAEADAVRAKSVAAERRIREKNRDLDGQEESLKAESGPLLSRVEAYNRQIREMSGGFGFFKNLFAMRRLGRERDTIESAQAAVAARLEAVRAEWARREAEHVKAEEKHRAQWAEATARAAGVRASIDALTASRAEIVGRNTVDRALAKKVRVVPKPAQGDPACPGCRSGNPAGSHFCRICARELTEDRPDLEGSLEELAELNAHHGGFSDGMKACQQIIALVRGLIGGLEAFKKSVEGMIESQNKHSLSTLKIDVPERAIEYGRNFEEFAKLVRPDRATHPKEFAGHVEGFVDKVFTESKIKGFFDSMGQELSRRAKDQWK